jgi:hypothetical protein
MAAQDKYATLGSQKSERGWRPVQLDEHLRFPPSSVPCPPVLPSSGWSSEKCWQVASSWDGCQVSRWRSYAAAVLAEEGMEEPG